MSDQESALPLSGRKPSAGRATNAPAASSTSRLLRWASAAARRLRASAYGLVACTLSTTVMAVIAWFTDAPFIFPSLGPSIILSFCTPRAKEASPRNMVGGHLIGAAAGLLALAVFGLLDEPSAIETGVTAARVLGAALSIGLTALGMVVTDHVHAPAGSTTLLISLGIFRTLENIGILIGAVLIVAVLIALNAQLTNRMVVAGEPRSS